MSFSCSILILKQDTILSQSGLNLKSILRIKYVYSFQDAVEMIRKKRRGAINTKQLEFLSKYKRRKYFIKVHFPYFVSSPNNYCFLLGEEPMPNSVKTKKAL